MEDEYTRRLDEQIEYYKNAAMQNLKEGNMSEYHHLNGKWRGYFHAKDIYIQFKEENQ